MPTGDLSFQCKHCGRNPTLYSGWCCPVAVEEARGWARDDAIARAVALLERSGYEVRREDAPPAPEPWAIESDA